MVDGDTVAIAGIAAGRRRCGVGGLTRSLASIHKRLAGPNKISTPSYVYKVKVPHGILHALKLRKEIRRVRPGLYDVVKEK